MLVMMSVAVVGWSRLALDYNVIIMWDTVDCDWL